jgi:signal transduction histidine kinase
VRRGLLLVALEALHNAARHSRARAVTLALAPCGERWELCVRDDGAGLPAPAAHNGGRGRHNMALRAQEIGGELTWHSAPGEGTTLCVSFRISGRAAPGVWLRRLLTEAR